MADNLTRLLDWSCVFLEKGKTSSPRPNPRAGPRELHFELTYSCDQQCLMCDIWPRYRKEPGLKKEELSLEEIKSLVKGSRLLGNLELILFSGGEPFLRPDLAAIVSFFAGKYPSVRLAILSNCFNTTLVLETLEKIFRSSPGAKIMLGTSLDGLGEKHDLIRGTPGAFERFRETLYGIQNRFPSVTVETNFTITRENADQIFPVYSFTRKEGIGFSAQFPVSWEGTADLSWRPGEMETAKKEIYRVMSELYNGDEIMFAPTISSLLVRLHYLRGMLDYELSPRRVFPCCPAPYRYAMLSPQGDLYFCPKLKGMTVGNIREFPFDRLWLGERANKVRSHINAGKCHCWLNCTTYLNIAEALKRGQPRIWQILLAPGIRYYRLYWRSLARVFRLPADAVRLTAYGGAFLFLLLHTAVLQIRRFARSKDS